jgi:outer membrane protein
MNHLKSLGIAVVVLLLSTAALVNAEIYSLDKCIEIAVQRNASIVAAKNNFEASKFYVYNSYGRLLPSVSITTSQSEYWEPQYGKSQSASGGITFRESFGGFGLANYADIKGQRAQRNSNYYGYVGTRQTIILAVKDAYYNLIKTAMLVDVANDAVKRGDEQLKVAQSRYDLGSAALTDVLKAKVLRSNAKLDLITAQNNYKLAKANLNSVMGIDISQEFDVNQDLPANSVEITYDQALNQALTDNASYKKSSYDMAVAKSELCAAKTNFLPDLSFTVNYGTGANKYFNLFNNDYMAPNATRSVGFSVSYNLFNNLGDVASLVAAKKGMNTAKVKYENSRNDVTLEVKQAFLDVQQNKEKITLNDESVAAAQEDLNIVREKYNLGAATIIEVLDAEVSFKTAQTNKVQALFDYNLAISRLEKAMGK